MSEKKVSLYQKISAVMQDVTYLAKDDDIEFKNTKYKAISEEKVTSTVRESLLKNRLIVLPIEQEHTREGTLTTVNVKYKIIDIDTGEYETIVSAGTGSDTQDKGVGKAMTYAFKYLFLRTFAIPTGEDPDKISSAELDEKQQKAIEAEEKRMRTEAQAKWRLLAGSLDGFDDFCEKQKKAGLSFKQINAFLSRKILEKQGDA